VTASRSSVLMRPPGLGVTMTRRSVSLLVRKTA
jgi:hypothetical protein